MQKITRDTPRKFAFDWRDAPLLKVKAGESFALETWDASSGFFRTPEDKAIPAKRPGFDRTPPLVNPIVGPIAIEGAGPNTTLAVTIEAIEVESYSWVAVGPNRGPLGDSVKYPDCSQEYTTKIFPHEDSPSGKIVRFNEKVTWPVTPFVGTLGVAPDREVCTSFDGQGDWGGNLDIRDFASGNTILLPVYHEGGLLYLGDVHASQGDTEFCGTAAETCATVRLHCEVRPQRVTGLRIIKPQSIVAVHSCRPLEVAVETATIRLIDWLVSEYGWKAVDAYCLVSTCPDFRINVYQMCRMGKLGYVAGAEIPKKYL